MVPGVNILSAIRPGNEVFEEEQRAGRRPRRVRAAVWFVLFFFAATCLLRAQNDDAWADFQQKATAWRALAVKPAVPQEVQQKQALAKNALQKQRLADAAADYEAGLKADPVWPEGHLNVAQTYARMAEYDKAIWHIRAYVALVPDAPEAQSAPDEITDWTNKSNALKTDVYLDPATRLMWPRHDSGGHLTRAGAIDYCGNLSLGNFDGWRVPTSVELKTIYEKNKKDDTLTCNGGNLDGARIRTGFHLSCNNGLVWESDLPYTNAIRITAACFGFRKAGGQWEYASESLKCPVLCVRDLGE